MLGRRKHQRFLLSEPVEASLRLREEVSIEQWGEHEIIVLSPEPMKPQERLTIEFPHGPRRRSHVLVLESRPAVVDDSVIRHRLRLAIERHASDAAPSEVDKP